MKIVHTVFSVMVAQIALCRTVLQYISSSQRPGYVASSQSTNLLCIRSIISDISIVSICKLRLNHSPIALPSQCRTFYLTVCKDVLCISTVMKEWFNEFFFLLSQEQNVCTMHIRELINKYTHFNYLPRS